MNAVEIEEAVSELANQPFDCDEFPFQFLIAFGNKDTTVRRLRAGSSNTSDVPGGVLQRSNIHIATSAAGRVAETLAALRESPRTAGTKAKFILATDGEMVEAEDLTSGEPLVCDYRELHEHLGFFLPLAGISTVTEIKNNPIDIKATGRLNKLYVELLKDNPEWGTREKRPALNQFMGRLIFCFFAEDTGIFLGDSLFTTTVSRMSTPGHGTGVDSWGNTHVVISELFRAMATNTRHNGQLDGRHRQAAGIKSWADVFPYVNGGLFSGSLECPKFSRIARSYLLRAGELDWKEINPDIFGSMIQAVADDDERGELGMHYTSVPNILKVLNPLFLDDLREQYESAGDNARKLRNLRKRIAGIRVFDPACGSGNFLVVAYLKMRELEHEIVRCTGDDPRSLINLTNFYGIEIKSFAVEIARLSLLIAEFQADCRYISQQEARSMVLPLHRTGQIHAGNALQLDWSEVCPRPSIDVLVEHDLAGATGRLALTEGAITGGAESQTFLCGNPPYLGGKGQSEDHKADLRIAFGGEGKFGELDYVAGWFVKAATYIASTNSRCAFVSTNSVNQGAQVNQLWPRLFSTGVSIEFAYEPFKWSNNASGNAAVLCTIIGIATDSERPRRIFGADSVRTVGYIGPYLVPDQTVIVEQSLSAISELPPILTGNSPYDGGHLLLDENELDILTSEAPKARAFVRPIYGSSNYISGQRRYCIWVDEGQVEAARSIPSLQARFSKVEESRKNGGEVARGLVSNPHRFRYTHTSRRRSIIVPRVSSERRQYLPAGILEPEFIISDSAQALYDPELWTFSILVSKMHLAWVKTTSGRLKGDLRYSSALSYNTFPLPKLTETNKVDLTRCAENILVAREAHFPATIGDLYDSESMPSDLRRAHEANDEILERIYIGRRFRNDTERLEKLFDLYTKMAPKQPSKNGKRAA